MASPDVHSVSAVHARARAATRPVKGPADKQDRKNDCANCQNEIAGNVPLSPGGERSKRGDNEGRIAHGSLSHGMLLLIWGIPSTRDRLRAPESCFLLPRSNVVGRMPRWAARGEKPAARIIRRYVDRAAATKAIIRRLNENRAGKTVQNPSADSAQVLERAKGIEPSYAAWEAAVLPLNYARERA